MITVFVLKGLLWGLNELPHVKGLEYSCKWSPWDNCYQSSHILMTDISSGKIILRYPFISLFIPCWINDCILKTYHMPWKESYDQSRQHIKKQRHHFADKCLYSQSYDFSSSHVRMWELDHKEGWASKNWYFWTVVLEKTLESSLDSKGIKLINHEGNQPRIFTGRRVGL